MNKPLLLWVALVAAGFAARAQDQVSHFEQKYPGQLAVTLKEHTELVLDLKKDSVDIVQTTHTEVLYLSEQANVYANERVYHSGFRKLESLEAWSMVPDKKGYRKVAVTDFKDTNSEESSIFYHDTKIRQFAFPGITRGTVTTQKERMRFTNLRLLPPFYFHTPHPAEEIKFTLKVHQNITIDHKLFYCGPEVKYNSFAKGGYVYHEWWVNDQKPFTMESGSPSLNYYSSHLLYKIKEVKHKTGVTPVLGSLTDLYAWQMGFIKEVVKAPTNTCAALVQTLVQPTDSELAKVEKIYAWVQENITYVAFEDGFRGFIPHSAELTLKNKYGDCKDMATLLYAMLKEAGIPSHLTWIGTRDLSYKVTDFNSQHAFNHMIVTYLTPERAYYLDPTDRHGLFGYPTSHIQNKEALISLNEKEYLVKQVEVPAAKANFLADTAIFSIKGSGLQGKGQASITGYPKIMATYRLSDKIASEQNSYLKDLLNKGSNKFIITDYTLQNLGNKKAPTSITYSCTIDDLVRPAQNELFLNLNLSRSLENSIIDTEKRKLPLEYPYSSETSHVFKVEIPDGYKVEFLPKEKTFSDSKFGFTITHRQEGRYIVYEKKMYTNVLLLEPADFVQWNTFIKELSKTYRESVILKKS